MSVVIPALDAASTIAGQLEALSRQEVAVPWEVLVVDNGSSDATVEIAEGFRDRLRLDVVHCTTRGTSAARNAGAARAQGRLLLFCDADDRVAQGWVTAMVEALGRYDAVGGAIEDELLNEGERDVPRHPGHLPVVAGFLPRSVSANLGVRRTSWDAVGGFAADYDYGSDDTEFCWRLQIAGHTLGYAPGAVVHYRHRRTLRGVAVKAYRTGRSRGRLFKEYRPHGMPRPRLAGALLRWARIVVMVPVAVVRPSARWWWADQAGAALGRVVGSIEHRVRYL